MRVQLKGPQVYLLTFDKAQDPPNWHLCRIWIRPNHTEVIYMQFKNTLSRKTQTSILKASIIHCLEIGKSLGDVIISIDTHFYTKYNTQKKFDKYLEHSTEIIDHPKFSLLLPDVKAELLLRRCCTAINAGRYEFARTICALGLQIKNTSNKMKAMFHNNMGVLLSKLDWRDQNALKHVNKAIQLDGDTVEFRKSLASTKKVLRGKTLTLTKAFPGTPNEMEISHCYYCQTKKVSFGEEKAMKLCGRCKRVAYCSKEHQKKHWKKHKWECKCKTCGAFRKCKC